MRQRNMNKVLECRLDDIKRILRNDAKEGYLLLSRLKSFIYNIKICRFEAIDKHQIETIFRKTYIFIYYGTEYLKNKVLEYNLYIKLKHKFKEPHIGLTLTLLEQIVSRLEISIDEFKNDLNILKFKCEK